MALLNRSRTILCVLIFILGLWSLVPTISRAQSVFEEIGRLPVTTYTPEEYGGSPQVWGAIQNEDGLMYFGTSSGIYEYDGVSWRSLFERNQSIAIRSFAKDSKSRVFYIGRDFGYLKVNPKGETEAVSLLGILPDELGINHEFFSLHFLSNFLYLQSREHLIRLELNEDFSLKSLKTWTSETIFTYTFSIEGNLLVHQTERGLYQVIGDELKLIPGSEILGKDKFRIMLPYPSENKNTFLLGGFTTGFFLFDGKTVSKFQTEVDQLIKESGGLLYNAIPFEGNYILSNTGEGIIIMNPKGKILRKINSNQGLPSDVVTGIYLDQSKGLWATTEDGIARIEINSPIQIFGKEHGINSRVVSITKRANDFFIGTSAGLLQFEEENQNFQSVPNVAGNQIFGLVSEGKDLIISGNRLQLYRDEKVYNLDGPNDGSKPSFLKIPKNHPNLLLTGTSTGLLVYRRGISKEYPWEYQYKVPNIGRISFMIFEGKEGTIFLGGGNSIYTLTIEENQLETDNSKSIKSKSFEFSTSDAYAFIDEEFYISTVEGVKKFSEKDSLFVNTDDFINIHKDLYDFGQTKAGQIWYESMDQKKYLLKRNEDGKFVKDNSPSSLGPYLSLIDFLDEDSIQWFGSEKGLIRYDPKKDNQTNKPFFTLIRRIETKTDTLPLPEYGRNKDFPAVERKDNSYRFEFAAPYFEDEKKTKYQTFLEGFDPDWVDWNDNTFKEYTNLSPGEYTFRVRAMAFTGRISEEAVYSFVVLAPWYATWWAYLIYAFLIGIAITAIVKWRSRQLKIENRLLEERVNERTAELEKSLEDLKSTQAQLIQSEKMASLGELTAGIAHEIQNPLNFVNNFSELSVELIDEMGEEIEKGDLEEVKAIASDLKDNLKKINHHGKRAGSIVKGMLAHSRKSSTEKEITDINALADECLRLSFHGLRAKDKSFTADFKTDLDPTIPKINVVSQDIGRVILNLINNAFYAVREKAKSAPSDFKPEVIVQTRKVDNSLIVKIHDNGQGIPESIKEKILQPFFTTKPAGEGTGLGLSLSYDIIKAHGGELKIESQEGEGTTFSIVLPAQN